MSGSLDILIVTAAIDLAIAFVGLSRAALSARPSRRLGLNLS